MLRVHSGISWSCFSWEVRRKAPKARRPSAREEEATRGLKQLSVVGRTVRCRSNHTRPVSWLRSALSGAHPRTKGACFCTGRRRHRVPLTRGVSWCLESTPGTRRPLQRTEGTMSKEKREAPIGTTTSSSGSRCCRDAHYVVEGFACWMSRGVRDRCLVRRTTTAAHGVRGIFRMPWVG